jgi:hypothetical protein
MGILPPTSLSSSRMFAQIARDGDRLELLLLSSRFGDGPTAMDERREYLLFYVHILSSKINNDRLFRLRLIPEPLNKFLARVA